VLNRPGRPGQGASRRPRGPQPPAHTVHGQHDRHWRRNHFPAYLVSRWVIALGEGAISPARSTFYTENPDGVGGTDRGPAPGLESGLTAIDQPWDDAVSACLEINATQANQAHILCGVDPARRTWRSPRWPKKARRCSRLRSVSWVLGSA
jgi:hypothetical protein